MIDALFIESILSIPIEPYNFKATRERPSLKMGKFIEYYYNVWQRMC